MCIIFLTIRKALNQAVGLITTFGYPSPAPLLQVFNFSLRFGQLGLGVYLPFRRLACAVVAGCYLFKSCRLL